MDNKTMKMYLLRYAKDHSPVCFDGVSIVCNNISALVFLVQQAREKVKIDETLETSGNIFGAMEITDAQTGQVVMDIEGQGVKR